MSSYNYNHLIEEEEISRIEDEVLPEPVHQTILQSLPVPVPVSVESVSVSLPLRRERPTSSASMSSGASSIKRVKKACQTTLHQLNIFRKCVKAADDDEGEPADSSKSQRKFNLKIIRL